MNINNTYHKWENKFGREYINHIYKNLEFIGSTLFEDRNLEDVLDTFFHYENLIREKQNHLNSINEEIQSLNQKKEEIINYSSNKLRYENKLISWLKNLNMSDISKLNSLININSEFNEVDRIKFEEQKRNRGKNITMNLNN